MQDSAHILKEQVKNAASETRTLAICGGRSKDFYGRAQEGERLKTTIHSGITGYTPTELVITARGGTPLQEIETALSEQGQMLACEPPHFSGPATFGGMLAAGLSGPSRPYLASVQDTVLGCTILNGRGDILRFGGKVMKNVAGYDISRLMVGSMGCLGIILEATVKVLPVTQAEQSMAFDIDRHKAGVFVNDLRRQGLPVTASYHNGNRLLVRFSAGTREIQGLAAQLEKRYSFINQEIFAAGDFWQQLKNHTLPFFDSEKDTWRLSVPVDADIDGLLTASDSLISEWGGCQHWLHTELPADRIFAHMEGCHGHATLFRARKGNSKSKNDRPVFQPLTTLQMHWHKQLKQAFDPDGIFNPGRMYPGF